MPNHIHVLYTPPEDINSERIAGLLKGGISHRLRDRVKGQLWEDGYHDVRMRTREQAVAAAEYIRKNPLKAELRDWPHVIFRPETLPGGSKPPLSASPNGPP